MMSNNVVNTIVCDVTYCCPLFFVTITKWADESQLPANGGKWTCRWRNLLTGQSYAKQMMLHNDLSKIHKYIHIFIRIEYIPDRFIMKDVLNRYLQIQICGCRLVALIVNFSVRIAWVRWWEVLSCVFPGSCSVITCLIETWYFLPIPAWLAPVCMGIENNIGCVQIWVHTGVHKCNIYQTNPAVFN